MWKKLLAMFIALTGVFTVGYAYYNNALSAANTAYNAGGNITGRINKMPSGLTSTTSALQKGDKVLMNVNNSYISDKLAWQLISYQTYSDYNCTSTTTCPTQPQISSWFALSDKPIAKTNAIDQISAFETGSNGSWKVLDFTKTKLYPIIADLNAAIQSSPKDRDLVTYRNLTYLHEFMKAAINRNYMHYIDALNKGIFTTPQFLSKSAYITSYYENYGRNEVGLNQFPTDIKDLKYSENYFYSNAYHDINVGGNCDHYIYIADSTTGTTGNAPVLKQNSVNTKYAVRPSVYLNVENTVFAVSNGNQSGVGNVHITKIPSNYTSLYTATIENKASGTNLPMKLRMYNSALNAQLNDIQFTDGSSISKITKDTVINLSANANAGNDGNGGIYTLSAILFDENNDFAYYAPLESAKGNGLYEFDLSGIKVGKYKVAVVNEAYNESLTSPADSSLISSTMPLEIVEPVSITVTPKTGLEYSKNVNQNDVVATYTTQGGIEPIITTLVGDSSMSGHENDDQLFALSNGNVIVKDPSGLHAGDYYFKINAIDRFGSPVGGVESSTVHIVVAKTSLTIAFDDPNITKKSINDATAIWNETATPNPNIKTKVTYDVSGGDVSLIAIDSTTGAITYKGNGAFGKVKIKATADDDPIGGHDNYQSAFIEKEIVIYREVDGNIVPDPNSSSTSVPTFTASDPNVKVNGIIGKIVGVRGTPDNLSSGTTTYTYGLKAGVGNASFFRVDANTGIIQTTANLGVQTYHITVTVSDQWSTKEIPITIHVGVAAAENLQFYETSAAIKMITNKNAVLTDTGVTVFATVKGSSNTNPVTYKIKDGSTNVIEVHPTSGAITIHGVGTTIIVAEKQGSNGQGDAVAELTFTVTAGTQNFIYTDIAGNELPKTGNYYDALKETYEDNKTFQVYTTGNPSGSSVTYQLKAGSPNDVITVDPDGTIHILNASMNTQIGKVIVEAISHDPSGNYADKTIELPITIEKGTRTIAFAENPIHVVSGNGSVIPNILVDGILDTSGTAVIEVDSTQSSTAWTNDGVTIQYNWNDAQGKDVKIHVTKPADRNYKASEADGVLHILGADENVLTLSTPGKIIYGDHFTIRSTQDDSASTGVQYSFTTDNAVFISAPTVNGNKAEFDALANSGNTMINVKVERTADGELPLTKTVQIKVLPKPITIQIEDKNKLRLEENPALTYQDFTSQLVSWNGVKDQVNAGVIQLSTTAKKYSPIGSYPITSGKAEKQLNDNYPNYTFTIKEGKLNIKDSGNKDFWDIDDDGCPDLNIKITDDEGNEITINGDLNEDGIPDYNIDINGDGKPDLNLDTDKDGRPDINLVMLKDWKPSKCITLGDIQFSSGISAKAEINVDEDSDGVPDINIDTNGDMKADINIKTGNILVNIANHTTWKPDKDYNHKGFLYDTQIDIKPLLNIDSDGDGRPDMNIDLDDDGNADINIDTDGDGIPNTNIDSDGDGKPDVNVDNDGDGEPDENIKEITEWKPEHNVDEPFGYDTMTFDEPKDPDDTDDKKDNEVLGSYYPGANMGGALTGDHTNIMMYIGFGMISLSAIIFILYKQKQKEN